MPNFQVLDARIASTLNRVIHNFTSKEESVWRKQKAQKQDRFAEDRLLT